MTEEIIIDGVNVAKCEFFNDCECKLYKQEYWERTDTTYDFCKEHPHCEYKATAILKRLEQENKELKENLLDKYSPKHYDIVPKHQTVELYNKFDNLKNQINTYRSALEEILESAKFAQCLPCGSGNLEDCLNCDDDTTNNGQFCMEKRIHDIKTKCVEVLNHSEG